MIKKKSYEYLKEEEWKKTKITSRFFLDTKERKGKKIQKRKIKQQDEEKISIKELPYRQVFLLEMEKGKKIDKQTINKELLYW
ncbi:MAG: hypothetical protein ACXACX_17915 [Candidatus Hodarchaeales archaeon]|jgi:hypothetical protein